VSAKLNWVDLITARDALGIAARFCDHAAAQFWATEDVAEKATRDNAERFWELLAKLEGKR